MSAGLPVAHLWLRVPAQELCGLLLAPAQVVAEWAGVTDEL